MVKPAPTRFSNLTGAASLAMRKWWRLLGTLVLLAVAASVVGTGQGLAAHQGEMGSLATLLAISLLYAALLAVPFVPSVEIGLLIMLLYGRPGILAAYCATLLGLNLAYLAGRMLRGRCAIAQRLQDRLTKWTRHPGGRPLFAGLALAALLNTPGNTAVGGGGGISLVYGAFSVLSWFRFAVCVALATALIPVLVLLGVLGVEQLMAS
ncbi:MAG: hypothetical protein JJU06_02485 [Ectothiorhodospiraceae bacterium]|nr:hypothetical protein [Ectothiorhodospiraceae bacterium]MCH8503480.1 hypothetical protein [Ectothiorhodospiraceae bacterium]